MSQFNDKRRFRKKVAIRPIIIPGQMGDGLGHLVYDAGANLYYCRIAGQVQIVYNDKVPAQPDILVDLGRNTLGGSESPGRFEVLSTRSQAPGGLGTAMQVGYAPAKRYEYMAQGGGQDPLWVQQRQYMPLRVGPLDGYSMSIFIYPGIIYTGGTAVKVSLQNADMTAHVPAGAGDAALVLITVDTTGALVATKGAEFVLADVTDDNDMLSNLPAYPAGTAKVSAAVRVYYSQTVVQEGRVNTDIIDLRDSEILTAGALPPLTANRVVVSDGSGNIGVDSEIQYSAADHALTLGGAPAVTGYRNIFQIVSDGLSALIGLFTWGDSFSSLIQGYHIGGTRASPSASTNGKPLFRVQGIGWDGVTSGGIPSYLTDPSTARIQAVNTEDQTSTHHGTRLEFAVTKNGQTTKANTFFVENDGNPNTIAGQTYNINGSPHAHDAVYAPIAKGVTNGDTHNHQGGDGATLDHSDLTSLDADDHPQYLLIIDSITGWIPVAMTGLTRVSNNSFTTTTDVTSLLQKGDKLKFTDTTTKYGVIYSVGAYSGTCLITLIATTDYILVGNPAAVYLGIADNPLGWPGKFNFTPAITYSGGITDPTSNTINTAFWWTVGTEFKVTIKSTLVCGVGNRTSTQFSIPITPVELGVCLTGDSITAAINKYAIFSFFFTDGKIYVTETMANDGNYWINGGCQF